MEEEEEDIAQDTEDADSARSRIAEMIETQTNEAKDKLEGVKVHYPADSLFFHLTLFALESIPRRKRSLFHHRCIG